MELTEYQNQAMSTAVYPRIYTEDQVRQICTYVLSPYDSVGVNAINKNRVEHALNWHETPFNNLVYPLLGLLGEAGELANKLKKFARDDKGYPEGSKVLDMQAELGDVLWYVAATASGLETELGEVARKNINKLASRQERGVLQGSGDDR